jgi:dihydrofolate reductase
MRKLIVSSLVTLDGVYGHPQSWASEYFDEEAVEESRAALLDSDAMLMGRGTYEYFAPAWSTGEGAYLERINEIRKYVFSSTLRSVDWNNAALIAGDPVDAVKDLKTQGDGHLMVYGYGRLPQTLLEHRLVDEFKLAVHPIVLGSGKPLFRPGERVDLRLESVGKRRNGVVTLSYTNALK